MADDGGQEERFLWKPPSGPKACLAVVGCGTLAALVVVGLVVGALRLFTSTISSSPTETEETSSTWQPATSMTPGALNLCRTLETSAETGTFNSLSPQRLDSGEEYKDEEIELEGVRVRRVSDTCLWTLQAENWEFALSYDAYAPVADTDSAAQAAVDGFDQRRGQVSGLFAEIDSDESVNGMGDETRQIYGLSEEVTDATQYVLVGRNGNGVFEIRVREREGDDATEPTTEEEFHQLVVDTVPVINSRIDRVLPV